MRIYARMKGHVQGVGYRYFVVQTAYKHHLTGWVRNCFNGDVECEAQGKTKSIEDFVASLKHGHTWARVDSIHTDTIPDKQEEQDFVIQH